MVMSGSGWSCHVQVEPPAEHRDGGAEAGDGDGAGSAAVGKVLTRPDHASAPSQSPPQNTQSSPFPSKLEIADPPPHIKQEIENPPSQYRF